MMTLSTTVAWASPCHAQQPVRPDLLRDEDKRTPYETAGRT